MHNIINGEKADLTSTQITEREAEVTANAAQALAGKYIRDRAAAHLPIQDQLDMLYWDKANGTELWRDYVAEIKTRIPKPV